MKPFQEADVERAGQRDRAVDDELIEIGRGGVRPLDLDVQRRGVVLRVVAVDR